MNPRIIERLHEMAAANDGRLTPDEVVAEAKSKDSPLHAYFASRDCWDAKKAQAGYCVIVARELIRSVRVEVTNQTFTIRAPVFVRDPERPADEQGYATLSRLRKDTDVARDAVVSEFARASACLARAQAIAAALNLSDEINDLRSRIDAFSDRISEGDAAH